MSGEEPSETLKTLLEIKKQIADLEGKGNCKINHDFYICIIVFVYSCNPGFLIRFLA